MTNKNSSAMPAPDPAAVRAACERLQELINEVTPLEQHRVNQVLTYKPIAGESLEATSLRLAGLWQNALPVLRAALAVLSSRDEAREALEGIRNLTTGDTPLSGDLTIHKRYESWPWRVTHSWFGGAACPTLTAAITALAHELPQQESKGEGEMKEAGEG